MAHDPLTRSLHTLHPAYEAMAPGPGLGLAISRLVLKIVDFVARAGWPPARR